MQSSDEGSCSECKLEIIRQTWTNILLKWLNKCVHPEKEVKILTPTCLSDIMNKYKNDICENDIDRAILCTDDIEPFIKHKYPILRLRYLAEASDYKKKQYIMTTVLLFHCCIKSQSGVVPADICKQMNKYEQEVILKLCERLNDMEITINNVDSAIKEAFDYVKFVQNIPKTVELSSSDVDQASTDESGKVSYDNLSSDDKSGQMNSKPSKIQAPAKYNSSVTVLPSVVIDTSTYSDLITESESSVHNKYVFSDSDEVSVYPIEHKRNKNKPKKEEQLAKPKDKRERRVDVDMKHKVRNYEGTEKPYYRDATEKKCFYGPKIDSIEKRRIDNILEEPKYKRQNREEVFKVSGEKRYSMVYNEKKKQFAETKHAVAEDKKVDKDHRCLENCSCSKCLVTGSWCGDPNNLQKVICEGGLKKAVGKLQKFNQNFSNISKKKKGILIGVVVLLLIMILSCTLPLVVKKKESPSQGPPGDKLAKLANFRLLHERHTWICKNSICQKVYTVTDDTYTFNSLSRCTLICIGPQLWPYPMGYTYFSKKIVALATNKLEYKFQSIPSEAGS